MAVDYGSWRDGPFEGRYISVYREVGGEWLIEADAPSGVVHESGEPRGPETNLVRSAREGDFSVPDYTTLSPRRVLRAKASDLIVDSTGISTVG